jgi:F-type H+-transporting ATPase subunit epsilon
MADPLQVEVVSPDGVIWSGKAVSVIARTTEGDIGILANHEPVIAALVPTAVEIVTTDGLREVVAVEGGFISVFANRISLLSDSAVMASEVSLEQAHRDLAAMHDMIDAGDTSDEEEHRYRQLQAQIRAGERYKELNPR